MVKIQCSNCQMILALPDNSPESLYICEYCKTLLKVPKNSIETGIVIKDFTILKKSESSNNEVDSFIAHNISLDRLVVLELLKKNNYFNHSVFFEISQAFARLNHKNISTIFDIGKEENIIFRSYEYNDGNFIGTLYKKSISQKIAISIFLDYLDFIFYFLKTKTGKCYNLLPDKAIITPGYQVKIIPSGLDIGKKTNNNIGIFKNITKLFLNMITLSNFSEKNNFLPAMPEKLKEFILANMNMTDNMFSDIIKGREKKYFFLYNKLKEEVSNYS